MTIRPSRPDHACDPDADRNTEGLRTARVRCHQAIRHGGDRCVKARSVPRAVPCFELTLVPPAEGRWHRIRSRSQATPRGAPWKAGRSATCWTKRTCSWIQFAASQSTLSQLPDWTGPPSRMHGHPFRSGRAGGRLREVCIQSGWFLLNRTNRELTPEARLGTIPEAVARAKCLKLLGLVSLPSVRTESRRGHCEDMLVKCSGRFGEGLGIKMLGPRPRFASISNALVSQAVRAHSIRALAGWSHAARRVSACCSEGSNS